ncbi:MAG: ABC transporter ATP-binding protein [Miniphocaeibacter sp.]|uniref:ABC transporter ATP-binding protein n=1 Tax=Miniphocaeibacter sp. TaxID=3100973 RepID=UPI0018185AA6|nr:ABC transporter ATP-binding protein [Gallicola sp.]
MEIVKAKELKKIYGKGETSVCALNGVNLTINKGEFLAIVGTSGSGKSTLLNILGGLDNPTEGTIIVDEKDLSKLNDEELTVFRRRNIGFVFQKFNLIPMLTVWENIILPIKLDGRKLDEEYIKNIIKTLGIENKLNSLPNTLSGGQQQRVAIARAISTKPAIILADEPTGNLDSRTSQSVMGLLKVTSREFNQTTVIITHNEEIAQLADRVLRLEDGIII